MADRKYLMRKRAEGQDATRERIVEATAALHSEHRFHENFIKKTVFKR